MSFLFLQYYFLCNWLFHIIMVVVVILFHDRCFMIYFDKRYSLNKQQEYNNFVFVRRRCLSSFWLPNTRKKIKTTGSRREPGLTEDLMFLAEPQTSLVLLALSEGSCLYFWQEFYFLSSQLFQSHIRKILSVNHIQFWQRSNFFCISKPRSKSTKPSVTLCSLHTSSMAALTRRTTRLHRKSQRNWAYQQFAETFDTTFATYPKFNWK